MKSRTVPVIGKNRLIGFCSGNRDAHGHGHRKGIESFFFEECHAGERLEISLNRRQGMVDPAGNLNRFHAVHPMLNRHAAMGYAGADILLLPTRGNHNIPLAELFDIPAHRTHIAEKQTGQIFLR